MMEEADKRFLPDYDDRVGRTVRDKRLFVKVLHYRLSYWHCIN